MKVLFLVTALHHESKDEFEQLSGARLLAQLLSTYAATAVGR